MGERGRKRSMALRQFLLWTLILFAIQIVALALTWIGTPVMDQLMTSRNILTCLADAALATFAGIVHYYCIYVPFATSKRYSVYALFCLVLLVSLFSLHGALFFVAGYPKTILAKQWSIALSKGLQSILVRDAPFLVFFTAIQSIRTSNARKWELQHTRRRTAALLLKGQLEPHFLFNTLNTIYAIAQKEGATHAIAAIESASVNVRDTMQATQHTRERGRPAKIESAVSNASLRQLLHTGVVFVILYGFILLGHIVNGEVMEDPLRLFVFIPGIIGLFSLTASGHYFWLYDRYIPARRYALYWLLLPLLAAGMVAADAAFSYAIDRTGMLGGDHMRFVYVLQVAAWQILLAGGIISAVHTAIVRSATLRRQRLAMERELQEDELQLQKNRTYNAYLCDAVDSILTAAAQDTAPNTMTALRELSDLLRYTTNDADKELVPVATELAQLEVYVHLQQLRIGGGENVVVTTRIFSAPGPMNIAPSLIFPFVENAFKYGISYELPSSIDIDIQVKNDIMELRISNTDHRFRTNQPSTGLGIPNVVKRLQLQYEGRYQLEQESENGRYCVHLRVQLA